MLFGIIPMQLPFSSPSKKQTRKAGTPADHLCESAESDKILIDLDVAMDPSPNADTDATQRGEERSGEVKEVSSEEDTVMLDMQAGNDAPVTRREYEALQQKYDEEVLENKKLKQTLNGFDKKLKTLHGELDTQAEEVREATKRTEEVKSELEEQRGDNRTLRAKSERLSRDINKKDRDYRSLDTRYRNLKFQFDQLQSQNRSLQSQFQHTQAQLQGLHQKNLTGEQECRRLTTQVHSQTMQHSDLQKRYEAATKLLDQRMKELQAAQEYFHCSRSYAGTDLIGMVDKLNGEIMQAAAAITETLKIEEMDSPRDRSKLDGLARQALSSFLSEDVFQLFYDLDLDGLEPLIQSALQAAIVHCCVEFSNKWSMDEAVDRLLRDIHGKQGSSVAACRWRSITKTHTKYASLDILEEGMRSVMNTSILSVLAIAGWAAKDNDHELKVQKVVNGRVSTIIGQAIPIDRILGLEMISEEWAVFAIPAGVPFLANSMSDVYASGGLDSAEAQVLCTTDLGLQKSEEKWQIMLKPKVLLNTAF
ncbi:hypothetical protein VNI00_014409 [Paramarasmius palmivorus]|uniref:Uncharacterized protein n=1 Tax=Paramarasmius palmivorus TaxID=297713 RepID=A0AAW0BS35_9AGAR